MNLIRTTALGLILALGVTLGNAAGEEQDLPVQVSAVRAETPELSVLTLEPVPTGSITQIGDLLKDESTLPGPLSRSPVTVPPADLPAEEAAAAATSPNLFALEDYDSAASDEEEAIAPSAPLQEGPGVDEKSDDKDAAPVPLVGALSRETFPREALDLIFEYGGNQLNTPETTEADVMKWFVRIFRDLRSHVDEGDGIMLGSIQRVEALEEMLAMTNQQVGDLAAQLEEAQVINADLQMRVDAFVAQAKAQTAADQEAADLTASTVAEQTHDESEAQ